MIAKELISLIEQEEKTLQNLVENGNGPQDYEKGFIKGLTYVREILIPFQQSIESGDDNCNISATEIYEHLLPENIIKL